jgi:hypothetical protein
MSFMARCVCQMLLEWSRAVGTYHAIHASAIRSARAPSVLLPTKCSCMDLAATSCEGRVSRGRPSGVHLRHVRVRLCGRVRAPTVLQLRPLVLDSVRREELKSTEG